MSPPDSQNPVRETTLWDWPLRLFHWSFAAAVIGGLASGWAGGNWIVWHERFGLAVIGLVTFRVMWGFLGPRTARFTQFVRGPAAILAYLRGQWRGVGHNPLGALSVLALLGVFALQAVGGLFANDDIAFKGPLMSLVGKENSDWVTGWHSSAFWWLVALIGVHLGAILYYRLVKRDNLIPPMITGKKALPEDLAAALQVPLKGFAARLLVSLGVAVLVVWVASGLWIPAPPPPPPTPSW